jgi:hypothetical protein
MSYTYHQFAKLLDEFFRSQRILPSSLEIRKKVSKLDYTIIIVIHA